MSIQEIREYLSDPYVIVSYEERVRLEALLAEIDRLQS